LTATFGGYTDQLQQILANEQAMTGAQSTIGDQITSLATGVAAVNRAQTAAIQTHRGGPFYNYYVKVTGKRPPGSVLTSNFVYQAWKSGVKATALEGSKTHPSAKNNQVAHPNPTHQQKAAVKPQTPKAAPRPAAKPAPAPVRRAAPKPPPKPSKPKASGVRR
jgi:hypothetical protein